MVGVMIRRNVSGKERERILRRCRQLDKKHGYDWETWSLIAESCNNDDPDRECYIALALGGMRGA